MVLLDRVNVVIFLAESVTGFFLMLWGTVIVVFLVVAVSEVVLGGVIAVEFIITVLVVGSDRDRLQ